MSELAAASLLVSLSSSIILSLVFTFIYLGERSPILALSSLSWWLHSLSWAILLPVAGVAGPARVLVAQYCALLGSYLLLSAAYGAVNGRIARVWQGVALAVAAGCAASVLLDLPSLSRSIPIATYQGAAYAYIGANILARAQQDRRTYRVYSWAAIVWGAYTILLPYIQLWAPSTIWRDLPGIALEITVALGIVFLYYSLMRSRQQETESRYRALFDAAADGILVIDRSCRVLDANAAVCRMLGHTREEVVGRDGADLLHLHGAAETEDLWAALEQAGPRGEIWGQRRNGEQFPCGVATSRVAVQAQEALMAHLRDRSEQHQADQTLRNSERRFRALFQQAINPIMLINAEGYYVDANRAALDFLDCGPEDFVGANFSQFAPPASLGLPNSMYTPLAEQRTSEVRFQVGGRIKTLLLNMVPVDLGSHTLVYAIGQDITEHKATLEALSESQRMLSLRDRLARILLTSAEDQVYDRLVPVVAEALNSTQGYLGHVADGDTLLFPSVPLKPNSESRLSIRRDVPDVDAFGPMGRRVLTEKRTITINDGLHVPPHHPPMQRAMAAPILYGGRAIGLLAVTNKETPYTPADAELLEVIVAYLAPVIAARQARDHEEGTRRTLEERLRQSEKMEALGRLAGGVAHDFNNLLTVINGYAQIVLSGLAASDPLAEDLGEIQAAGERAAGLTRQLLAFSRRQALDRQALDVNAVLRGMSNMLGRLIGEHIALELNLEAALWPVRADVGQMEQVVMNLAVNARDAMPAGGRLAIATANLSLGQPRDPGMKAGDYVVLTLMDTGAGLPDLVREHLFEPFYSTKGEQGTGLGLATVYGIVRQTAGYIEVSSEPGAGTTFTIYLPRAQANAPQAEPEPAAAAHGRERVLLVEDQAPVRQMTARMLRQLGYAVTEADSAAAAEGHWTDVAEPFDLLITDVLMPGTGGPELVARLRRARPDLPALFISGYPQDMATHAVPLDPPVRLLPKPFTVEELAAATRRALDGRRVAQPGSA